MPSRTGSDAAPPRTERPAVQRWRIRFARVTPAGSQRDESEAWEAAVLASGLPVATTGGARSRPRLAFPVPLPAGATATFEPLDLLLAERRTAAQVRAALAASAPPGAEVVAVHDVWLGAQALAAATIATDWRIAVSGIDRERLVGAIESLLDAPSLERERRRGDRVTRYDLRPLVVDARLDPDVVAPALLARLAVEAEGGAGRPDELVAALAEIAAVPIAIDEQVRIAVRLADDRPLPRLGAER